VQVFGRLVGVSTCSPCTPSPCAFDVCAWKCPDRCARTVHNLVDVLCLCRLLLSAAACCLCCGVLQVFGRRAGFIAVQASLASGVVDMCLIPGVCPGGGGVQVCEGGGGRGGEGVCD
jgi:hypothetical protein